LAVIKQRCQERGFSERAATLIAGGGRSPTLGTCSKRLAPYYQWCRDRDISPTRASVAHVSDFLAEKFDTGLEAATVRNYKSAILSIHRGFEDGSTINDDGSMRLLLEGMFNTRPPRRSEVPPWDLNTVLDYIKGPPFEPLKQATLKNVTLKTVFLLALASARRCSELHALSASASVLNRAGATLFSFHGFSSENWGYLVSPRGQIMVPCSVAAVLSY
jgi:site-specific recombinase XerD